MSACYAGNVCAAWHSNGELQSTSTCRSVAPRWFSSSSYYRYPTERRRVFPGGRNWLSSTPSGSSCFSQASSAYFWPYNGVALNIHGTFSPSSMLFFAVVAFPALRCRDGNNLYFEIKLLTSWKRRNGRIIALLTLAGCLLIGFVAVQIFKPKTATIPPRIFCQRSILAGFCSTFCIGSSMMIMVYYLPIYFVSILQGCRSAFLGHHSGHST